MYRSDANLKAIRDSVSLVGRLSDSIVRVGPLSVGIDGVLSWIPGVGEVYSAVAGGFIVLQGARAGVSLPVLAGAVLILGARTLGSSVPIAGAIFSDMFTAHKWAAKMVVEAIDRKLGLAPDAGEPADWRRPAPGTTRPFFSVG
jgi:hypothetical protein